MASDIVDEIVDTDDTGTTATPNGAIEVTDGTAKYRIRTVFQMPVGAVTPFAGNTVPEGWLLCDGSAISRTDYDELFSVIGTSYGRGDGSTTFNLPNLVDKFVEGGSTSGGTKAAGLPTLPEIELLYRQDSTSSGVYASEYGSDGKTGSSYSNTSGTDEYMQSCKTDGKTLAPFGAKYYSGTIYGASTTVQPPAIVMKYIIKA